MHEVAAIQGVVSTIIETMHQAGGERITSVHLVLGASTHLSEESARQHFALLSAGTAAEHVELVITWVPAEYQCFSCGKRFDVVEVTEPVSCPDCDGIALEVAHQDLCYASEIKIETRDTRISDRPSMAVEGA
jgi:hydrogenase nickel insertion protein HypA